MLAQEAGLVLDTLKYQSRGALYGILSWGVSILLFWFGFVCLFVSKPRGRLHETTPPHLSSEAKPHPVLSHQSESAHGDTATHTLLSAYLTVLIRHISKRTTQNVVSVIII